MKQKGKKTIAKIEATGYKVSANIGYQNGEQTIVSYTAERGSDRVTRPNPTQLWEATRNS
jgi:hypothetical protein